MTTESSDEEWEEVEESQKPEDLELKNNVEVELELPDALKKKKKKADREREEIETCIRRAAKRYSKEVQIATHKTHLLCLLSLGMRLNRLCNEQELQSRVYSLLPIELAEKKPKDMSVISLTRLLQSVTKIFTTKNGPENLSDFGILRINKLHKMLTKYIEARTLTFKLDLVLIFILIFRAMGFTCRLVMSLQPMSLKILTDKQKESQASKRGEKKKSGKVSIAKRRQPEKIPQVDGAADDAIGRVTRSRSKVPKLESSKEAKQVKPSRKTVNKQTQNKRTNKTAKISQPDDGKENGISADVNMKKVVVKVEKLQPKDQNDNETPIGKDLGETKAKRTLRTSSRKSLIKKEPKEEEVLDNDDEKFQPIASSDSESDFELEKKATKRRRHTIDNTTVARNLKTVTARNIKSSSKKQKSNEVNFFNEWIEIFFEKENKWYSVDVFRCTINHPELMEKYATPNVHYAVGFENDGSIKDVTPRYASKWLTETRKLRIGIVDKDWWKKTLGPYATKNQIRDKEENAALQEALLAQPIPSTISAFKNHPLFGLRRHLLKYEAIYPPDVPAVGLVRGEEIFPRSSIYTLHTRDKWLQEARTVKDGEEPYKMVASLWINMKMKQDMATLSLPLFGIWQTEPYVPGVAKDGKVPRNQYGNVDLFKPSMMPIGCVQLRLAGLSRVARKLNIDIAEAITGFDSHSGYPHPVTDGYIVCEEHEEVLVAAWREDQVHAAEREQKKREQRIYGLWKQIIRGALALERVKRKYAVKKDANSKDKGTVISTESATAWQAKRLEEAKRKRGRGRQSKENLFPFEMAEA